jgi:comEA protein
MLDLTPSEKRTIFIISGILILSGLFYILRSYSEKPEIIDYARSDSIFSRLTHNPPTPEKNIEDISVDNIHTSATPSRKSESVIKIKQNSIDINTATIKELEKLPRIGPAMANRIIEHRKTKGFFKSLNELKNVKGIGKKTFNLIKPYLREIQ